jgi:ABC-type lipoprotein release transport system permease subunit
VLAYGAVALSLGTVALAIVPAWQTSRRGIHRDASTSGRPSFVATMFAQASMPASGVAGAQLAFQAGRGAAAVPVRSSVIGVAFGIAVLISAVTFGSSLNRLIDTPQLYGRSWDAFLTHYGDGPDLRDRQADLLDAPGVGDIAIGADVPLEIEGKQVFALGIERLRGASGPPITEGVAPRNEDEIALSSRTLRRTGVGLGDTIKVRIPVEGVVETAYTVVGQTVIPPFGFAASEPGEGALLTIGGVERMIPDGLDVPGLVSDAMIRFAPGADRRSVIAALAPLFGRTADEFGEGPSETPEDVISFGRVRALPLALGSILGGVAAATVAYTVASSVRRRRRDLAILKTLGFEKRHIRATVAWQATAIVAAALVLAVPSGVVLGRWTWRLLAEQIGVVPVPVVPAALIGIVAMGAVLVANLIAALPGHAAARLRPAVILRAE